MQLDIEVIHMIRMVTMNPLWWMPKIKPLRERLGS